jgi:hypothetical protein
LIHNYGEDKGDYENGKRKLTTYRVQTLTRALHSGQLNKFGIGGVLYINAPMVIGLQEYLYLNFMLTIFMGVFSKKII